MGWIHNKDVWGGTSLKRGNTVFNTGRWTYEGAKKGVGGHATDQTRGGGGWSFGSDEQLEDMVNSTIAKKDPNVGNRIYGMANQQRRFWGKWVQREEKIREGNRKAGKNQCKPKKGTKEKVRTKTLPPSGG